MSTSGDTMSTSGGYHEYIGGVQYVGGYKCGIAGAFHWSVYTIGTFVQ